MSIDRITHLLEQMHRSEDDAGDPIDADMHLVTDGARGFTWEPIGGGGGPTPPTSILLESGHATPFTFDDILQESDGSDFLWASE